MCRDLRSGRACSATPALERRQEQGPAPSGSQGGGAPGSNQTLRIRGRARPIIRSEHGIHSPARFLGLGKSWGRVKKGFGVNECNRDVMPTTPAASRQSRADACRRGLAIAQSPSNHVPAQRPGVQAGTTFPVGLHQLRRSSPVAGVNRRVHSQLGQ
jgi:hypothetical protein